MRQRTTLKDIATEAKVSKTAVSMALRHDPSIPRITRARILRIAKKLNYRPDPSLAVLGSYRRFGKRRQQYQMTIAFVMAGRSRDVFEKDASIAILYQAALMRSHELGYHLDVLYLNEYKAKPDQIPHMLNARGIRGILVFQHITGKDDNLDLDISELAAVCLQSPIGNPSMSKVASNHHKNVFRMCHTLHEKGYRRIGYLLNTEAEKQHEYLWLSAYLLFQKLHPDLSALAPLSIGMNQVKSYHNWLRKWKPDAVIAQDDNIASLTQSLGYHVPKEIAIAHINLLPCARETAPVSGMSQQLEIVGRVGTDLLHRYIITHQYGSPAVPETILIDGKWIDYPPTARQYEYKGQEKLTRAANRLSARLRTQDS